MNAVQAAYIGSDLSLNVTGLLNSDTAEYVNDAVVTVTVVDRAGVELAGQSWPETLDYVAASNGDYRCTLQETVAWVDDRGHQARITAVGDGLTQHWRVPVVGVYADGGTVSQARIEAIAAKDGVT